jgi:hypothetical protein
MAKISPFWGMGIFGKTNHFCIINHLKILVMKKITPLVIILVVLFSSLQSSAKIWRVNNNPSLDGDVLQGSILFDNTNNATNPEAAAGDSVYLEPSATTYNSFEINKANIVVLGYGYFLSSNPGSQANANNARIQYISFLATSTGSNVSGVEVVDGIYIYASNVTATRCFVNYMYLYNATNATGIRIDKCYIRTGLNDQGVGAAVTSVTIAVENCIFSGIGDGTNTTNVSLSNKIRGLFRNNVMNYNTTFYAFNFYIANNIFIYQTSFGSVSNSGNNVFRNNLFSFPITLAGYAQVGGNTAPNSGNVFSVNMANVFNGPTDNVYNPGGNTYNNYILLGAFTPESRYELKAGSTALLAGESGTTFGAAAVTTPNCGAYGATDPYRKGGFPAIPRIYSLTVPSSVPNGAPTMTIAVSSSSNN